MYRRSPITFAIMASLYVLCLLLVSVRSSASAATVLKVSDATLADNGALTGQSPLPVPEEFLNLLIEKYGSDGTLSVREFGNLLGSLNSRGAKPETNSAYGNEEGRKHDDDVIGRKKPIQEQETTKCYSTSEIMLIHNLEPNTDIDPTKISEMCPSILQQIGIGCSVESNGDGSTVSDNAAFTGNNNDLNINNGVTDTEDGRVEEDDLLFERVWLQRAARSADDHHDHGHGHGHDEGDNTTNLTPPSKAETWGYGFLCVTIISCCSLVGAFVIPLMKKKIFQNLLMFLICLAVGSLSGGALMHLIPEATGNHPDLTGRLKSLTVLGGIYLFFLTEKFMKMVMNRRKKSSARKTEGNNPVYSTDVLSMHSVTAKDDHPGRGKIVDPVIEASAHRNYAYQGDDDSSPVVSNGPQGTQVSPQKAKVSGVNAGNNNVDVKSEHNDHVHGHKGCAHTELATDKSIASVAYMIILGDGLHNFIDGLAIGAAFSVAVVRGISICIAIVCEELPHELGDFAILLNAGMPLKRALLFNFLSACMCYLGLVFGILLSELVQGASWIFAIAGGMFLYISLVDMLPEINTAEEKEGKKSVRALMTTFILQNLGLLTGWCVMFVLGVYEHDLNNLLQ
ncbi:metal cation symporter ZIP14-like isoform X1 [Ptychodera flava]|uniref:metal cation symporter ZIP14-like isoform X1 n=1 Tax=Ptychodera flava TaxID=63121 RepID=UPI00396A8B7E